MKKIILFMFLITNLVFGAVKVGYIDIQKITNNYSYVTTLKNKINDKKALMEKELLEEKKNIEEKEKTLNKDGKIDANEKKELDNMKEKFNQKAAKYERELMELQNKELQKIKVDIEKACKIVSKEKKLDVIIDKVAVFYGAIDVTDDVLKKMEK